MPACFRQNAIATARARLRRRRPRRAYNSDSRYVPKAFDVVRRNKIFCPATRILTRYQAPGYSMRSGRTIRTCSSPHLPPVTREKSNTLSANVHAAYLKGPKWLRPICSAALRFKRTHKNVLGQDSTLTLFYLSEIFAINKRILSYFCMNAALLFSIIISHCNS